MKEELDDLSTLWQQAKNKSQEASVPNVGELIMQASAKKRSTLVAHFGNAAVLTLTVAVLMFYFYYLYNFQFALSKIGYNLMIGGLIVRIAIEIYSALRSRSITVSDTAAKSLQNSVAFYEFRKRIHGPVTIIIFGLYFIGFYMLTPEFSRYFSLGWMILIDGSALIIAAFLAFFIRKGIKQELCDLEKMMELQRNLLKS